MGYIQGTKRQGRKDNVNIDSSLWSQEAISNDVIRISKNGYPPDCMRKSNMGLIFADLLLLSRQPKISLDPCFKQLMKVQLAPNSFSLF